MKKKVFVINGFKRSGKDFVGGLISEYYKGNSKSVKILPFAKNLKDIMAKTLNLSDEELDYLKNKEAPLLVRDSEILSDNTEYNQDVIITDVRKVLQIFGTEAMKPVFGDDVWADLVKKEIQKGEYDVYIVPDFRFLIEFDKMSELKDEFDVKFIYVYDLENPTLKQFKENPKSLHISEREIPESNIEFDIILDNTNKKLTKNDIIQVLKEI